MSKPVPMSAFDTAPVPPARQFEAWREILTPMFDVAPPDNREPLAFEAAFETYLVGPLVLGGTTFDAHRYGRDPERIRRDGLNHYHLQLHLSGGYAGRFDDRDLVIGPGDMVLFDFARPLDVRSHRSDLLVIAVPRDILDLSMPPGDHHGLVLRGDTGLGGLLADHMRSLAARLPQMTIDEATAAAAASTAMIAACFRPSQTRFDHAQPALLESLGQRIRTHIGGNLRGNAITVDALCATFGLSRATLYRLFKPFGGVSAYVRNQRLSRAFTSLMSPLEGERRIADIAFEWGFNSEAYFSRAFREAFGLSPSDARAAAHTEPPAERTNHAFRDWVTRLRRT
jgi:AraC-like DNA-binding protein